MNTEESLNKLCQLKNSIERMLSELNSSSDPAQKEENKSPDETYFSEEFHSITQHLFDIAKWISYLNSPILYEGTLSYISNRYFIDEKALQPEDMVEIFKQGLWQRCMVYEISGKQSIHDFNEIELVGRTARLRGRAYESR